MRFCFKESKGKCLEIKKFSISERIGTISSKIFEVDEDIITKLSQSLSLEWLKA
jgi:hypothetical protein